MGGGYFQNALDNPHLYRAMFVDHPVDDDGVGIETFFTLVDAVRDCIDAGRFRRADPEDLARQIWVGIHGVVTLHLAGLVELGAGEQDLPRLRPQSLRGLRRHPAEGEGVSGQDNGMVTPEYSGMLTDLYELTMARAYIAEGMAETSATFSLFVRELPRSRGYLVAAGLDDALSSLETLAFSSADVAFLETLGLFDTATLDRLGALRFTGSVRAVPEGTVVFGSEPILEVTGPAIEAQIAETILLNQITTATTLASKAARYRHAARGKTLVDFAFRRAQGVDSAMHLVRAVAICGLAGTSNVAGAQRYDVPLSGTMAHSFIQAHTDERAAFGAFRRTLRRPHDPSR